MKLIIIQLDSHNIPRAREISKEKFLIIQDAFFDEDIESINTIIEHGYREIRIYVTADEVRKKFILGDKFISPQNKLLKNFDEFISQFDLLGPAKELLIGIDLKNQTIGYSINKHTTF